MIRLACVCTAIVVGCTVSAMALADDQDTIDYRHHIMMTMGEEAAAIAMIRKQQAPAADLDTHIQILAITAATAKRAFEPKVAGGLAKADVWTHWDDVARRLDQLTAATANLAQLSKNAKTGGAEAEAKFKTALADITKQDPCESCHDKYREPPKKK